MAGMSGRPRHQNKELEAVLQEAEAKDWRVDRPSPRGYFRMRCPCGLHQRRVHLTPSNPNYERNLRKWLERQPCWTKETGQ
jgi:hypothetical protein